MQMILKSTTVTTEINRSKFIAHLIPISEFDGMPERLKREHPKASHVVYALRRLNEHDQIVENSTYDGEPKGCVGVPSLNVLRGEDLIECAVVTVCYFGGIKLGTGGMVRTYAQAVKNVIAEATLVPYEKQIEYSFKSSYSDVERVLYHLQKAGITKYERDFGVDGVTWQITGSQESIAAFRDTGLG